MSFLKIEKSPILSFIMGVAFVLAASMPLAQAQEQGPLPSAPVPANPVPSAPVPLNRFALTPIPTNPAATHTPCKGSPVTRDEIVEVENRIYDRAALVALQSVDAVCGCPNTTLDVVITCTNAILSKATDDDIFTKVITPEELKARDDRSGGVAFGGLGVIFQASDPLQTDPSVVGKALFNDTVWIVRPDSPAAKAGIHPGDQIEVVGKNVLTGLTLDHALDKLKGPVGSTAELQVRRDGKLIKVNVKRQSQRPLAIGGRKLRNGTIVLTIASFEVNYIAEDLQFWLSATLPEAKAYIIDVRSNGGGWVEPTIDCLTLLIPQGTLYTVDSRRNSSDIKNPVYEKSVFQLDSKKVYSMFSASDNPVLQPIRLDDKNRLPYMLNGKPLVLLVDGATASAAEIFTAALHQNAGLKSGSHAAFVIGEQTADNPTAHTFGKGIGQSAVRPRGDTPAVNVTTFRWFTPNGTWLGDAHNHRFGEVPDLPVKASDTKTRYTSQDAALATALAYLTGASQSNPADDVTAQAGGNDKK